MRLVINGKPHQIPNNMTEEMLNPYIAAKIANPVSLPELIHIVDIDFRDGGKVIYQNLLHILSDIKIQDLKPIVLKDVGENSYKAIFRLEDNDIIKYWIYVHRLDNNKLLEPTVAFLAKLSEHVSGIDLNRDRVKVWLNEIHDMINKNTVAIKELDKNLGTLKKVPLTNFEVTEDNLVLGLPVFGTALEALDKMNMSAEVPFATAKIYSTPGFLDINRLESDIPIKMFYKVYTEDTKYFNVNWLNPDDEFSINSIKFYINNTTGYKAIYTPAYWDVINGKITVSVDTKSGMNRNVVIDLLLRTLNLKTGDITVVKSTSGGSIVVPNTYISKPIFLDLIFTDPLSSRNFYVDEHEKTSLEKERFKVYYRASPNADVLNFNVSHKQANAGDYGMESGDYYVNLHIRNATDTAVVDRFRDNMSLLLAIYNTKYPAIMKEYNKYVGDVEEIKFAVRGRKMTRDTSNLRALKSRFPDQFGGDTKGPYRKVIKSGSGYARRCSEGRQPRYVNVPDMDRLKEQETELGRNIVVIPKDLPDDTGYRGFYCPQDDYPIADAIKVDQHIFEKYKYMPCCFKKPKGTYADYIGEGATVKATSTTYITSTKKLLTTDRDGAVPNQIVELMRACGFGKDIHRHGVSTMENPDNFLLAVSKALNIPDNVNMRKKILKSKNMLYAGRQECYNIPIKRLRKMLKDEDHPIITKYFHHIVELVFNCNIIMLKEDIYDPEQFHFARPNHTLAYIQPPVNKGPTIILWQRDDSIVEVITRGKGVKRELSFSKDLLATKNLLKLYTMYNIHAFAHNVSNKPIFQGLPVVAQVVDNYGKRRGLVYENGMTILSPPSYPVALPIVNTTVPNLSDILPAINDDITGVFRDKSGIATKYGNIPCVLNIKLGEIPVCDIQEPLYTQSADSVILNGATETSRNYRIASFLFQNLMYIYSDTGRDMRTLKKQIVIDKNIQYKLDWFGRCVTDAVKSPAYQNGKLVCSSKILRDRMIGWLSQLEMVLPELVKNYNKQKCYLDYYQFVEDFRTGRRSRVFDNDTQLLSYYQDDVTSYPIYTEDGVPFNPIKPYFIWNREKKRLQEVV